MALEENNQNKPDINEFLKSLQNESSSPARADEAEEGFPFTENFDMEAFAEANNNPLERTLTSIKAQEEHTDNAPASPSSGGETEEIGDFNLSFETEMKEQSIKNLEDKIAELESRLHDVNKEKSLTSAFASEINDDKEETKFTPNVKANDEFYKNISSTIENLKSSLENIVSARLEYEENILRQDATLISRLRDKTSRLKAINLALNSEVKRAKNEKLEHLRRSAEQTKELLSIRMQLSKVEEKARHGDFKLANLEQHITFLNSQKSSLDEEILKVREDKLESLRKTAEQTKEIMSLRLELSKTEEKFKQEELQAGYLRDQLKNVEEQRAALDNELYSTRSAREEANRKAELFAREAQTLKADIERVQAHLKDEAAAAGTLREKIFALETELQHINSEKASLLLKNDAALRQLEAARAEHEREIAKLQAAQVQEIELIKSQKVQEAQTITLELRRAEDKYRAEETLVNTLKLQIESLGNDVKNLDAEKAQLKGKSSELSKEIEFIKEGHRAEIENLKRELNNAQEKLTREQSLYNTLSGQLKETEEEKAKLSREIHDILAAKEDALKQNDAYVAQIQEIKAEHARVLDGLKANLADLQAKNRADAAALEDLKKSKEEELSRAKQQGAEASSALEKARSLVRENEGAIAMLKGEVAAMAGHKMLIDGELKKANGERYEILKKLEEKTKEFEAYRKQHESEIAALREEKAKEAGEYKAKIDSAEERIKQEEGLVFDLKEKIAGLETEKQKLSSKAEEGVSLARKAAQQTEEIISLKNQLAKAESRFLQDTVLISQLKEQFANTSGTASLLDSELKNLRDENMLIQRSLSAREEEIRALKDTLSRTQEQLQAETETVKQLQEHTARLKAVNIALDTEVKKVQEEKLSALKKSAEQAKEILALKEQLTKAESGFKTLDFENGIISIRKEYEAKVENLETQLKDASARFAEQVKEIQGLKADNTRLKQAESEKIKIETEYKLLAEKSSTLENQLKYYEDNKQQSGLVTVKMAALTAQIVKIKREKTGLEQKLSQMQQQIAALTQGEKEKNIILNSLKEKINRNDVLIEQLKKDIVVLTTENRNLKADAEMNNKRERVLQEKISEVEGENKKLETLRVQAPAPAQNTPAVKNPEEVKKAALAAAQRAQFARTTQIFKNAPQQNTQADAQNKPAPKPASPQPSPAQQQPKPVAAAPQAQKPEAQPVAAKPAAQQPAKEADKTQYSVLDFAEPTNEVEIVDIESGGDNLDLSLIFTDEAAETPAPKSAAGALNKDDIHNVGDPMDLTDREEKQAANNLRRDNSAPDHAPKNHGIVRKPVGRVPHTFQESAAYSDFLKKTRSVFYRIKWSLFKDE